MWRLTTELINLKMIPDISVYKVQVSNINKRSLFYCLMEC